MTFLAIFLLFFGSLRIVMYVCFLFFTYLILFLPYKQRRGGGLLPDFLFVLSSPCSADHESGIGHVNYVFLLGD